MTHQPPDAARLALELATLRLAIEEVECLPPFPSKEWARRLQAAAAKVAPTAQDMLNAWYDRHKLDRMRELYFQAVRERDEARRTALAANVVGAWAWMPNDAENDLGSMSDGMEITMTARTLRQLLRDAAGLKIVSRGTMTLDDLTRLLNDGAKALAPGERDKLSAALDEMLAETTDPSFGERYASFCGSIPGLPPDAAATASGCWKPPAEGPLGMLPPGHGWVHTIRGSFLLDGDQRPVGGAQADGIWWVGTGELQRAEPPTLEAAQAALVAEVRRRGAL